MDQHKVRFFVFWYEICILKFYRYKKKIFYDEILIIIPLKYHTMFIEFKFKIILVCVCVCINMGIRTNLRVPQLISRALKLTTM